MGINKFSDYFIELLQKEVKDLSNYHNKYVKIRYKDVTKIPSKCRTLEIPTKTVYKTVKDVCDNYETLLQIVDQYNLAYKMAEDILTNKKIKDNTFVDISFISTNRSPTNKCGALLFCWKMKGSKR